MTSKRFIEQYEENVRNYPDKVIARDCETQLTFRELDDLSGRVYAYLKEKGIGKEDVVMVALPRRVSIFVSILGIWKAGAAMVCVEIETTPASRINYIFQNSHCKLKIDDNVYQDMMTISPLQGHVQTDLHDAAMLVYTSGSEGNPKGLLYEYGKLDIFPKSYTVNGIACCRKNDNYCLWFPANTGAIGCIPIHLCLLGTMDIIPAEFRKDPRCTIKYFNEHKITFTGIVPSVLKPVSKGSMYLREILIGAEILSDAFSKKIDLVNLYSQTESGAPTFTFKIDKRYDNTPIGKPTCWVRPYLLDDDDTPVAEGQSGELCYENPYTRGYINDPELTAKVFRNGVFHTGDIARINEDGNYVILGRKTDMIKINGNRIEPAEIEAVVKHVLNIDWAFAKGFITPERSFICVYYTADIKVDLANTREELLKVLPTYMIPSYFIHINEIPRLPNGKVNRKAFQAPDVEQYRTAYTAPTNELEERLCHEMEQILHIDRIGITDDFYLLGGDSLRTIELVTKLGIEGLTVTDIYSARTPQAISNCWMKKMIE